MKLALAVALAADAVSLRETLRDAPGFRELCEASGIFTGEVQNRPPDALDTDTHGRKRRRGPLALEDGLLKAEIVAKRAFQWHFGGVGFVL